MDLFVIQNEQRLTGQREVKILKWEIPQEAHLSRKHEKKKRGSICTPEARAGEEGRQWDSESWKMKRRSK